MTIHSSWHLLGNAASLHPGYGAAFRDWLATAAGQRFLHLEQQRLAEILPTLFGYDAVLVGEPQFAACLQNSKIKNQFIVNDDLQVLPASNPSLVYARQDRLPIGSNLVDLLYLAHTLEFSAHPHAVLREAHRILRADGHLVITMFNPLSIWGLWKGMAKYVHPIPWKANFMAIVKLKDWLALLGFDIMQVQYFGFNLPINKSNYSSQLSLFERYGQKMQLPFGAGYLIEASKRVIPLTPITPAWRKEPDIIEDDVTEPTA